MVIMVRGVWYTMPSGIRFDISESLKEKARTNADTSHCDNDRGRSAEQHKIDAPVGYLSEKIAGKVLRQEGFDVQDPTDRDHDFLVNGSKVEVKGRKVWNYKNPDLLVRKTFGVACSAYVQVDLHTENGNQLKPDLSNLSHAVVVGFASASDVHQHGESFLPGKKNDTDMVPRNCLRPIGALGSFL